MVLFPFSKLIEFINLSACLFLLDHYRSDLDRSVAGTFAAQKLAERAKTQGIQVEIREPSGPLPIDAKSIDWLDVLNQRGPNAFVFRSVS
jgi:hypothetical protein